MEPREPSQYSQRIFASFLGAFVGAELGVLAAGAFAGRTAGIPVLTMSGLLLPVGLLLGLSAGLWTLMLHGATRIPSLQEFLQNKHRRWGLILSGPGVVLAWWAVGQLALRLLVAFHGRPLAGGALMATSSLGCFVFTAWVVSLGATLLCRTGKSPSMRVTLLLAIGGPILLSAALVFAGSTSGVGSPWALFGVFKREELELRPIWELLLIAGFAYGGALMAVRWRFLVAQLVLGSLAALLMFTSLLSASRLEFRQAVRVERAPGVAVHALKAFQRLSDADGDGAAARFGGGDCNDARPDISPFAKEIPDNGEDENCSGSDLTIADEAVPATSPEKQPSSELPADANFLLLTIDTLRYDLGYSGAHNNPKLSPKLDQLAARSTVFKRAYSLASYTSKSLGPMMIGRYPSETARTFEHFDRFPKNVPFVQERLQNAGIRTVSVQGYWYFFFKNYGFERGWDVLDSSAAPKVVAIEGDKTSNGDELADAAILQLESLANESKRFFMWTHWVDPHAEYVAHADHDYGSDSRERYDGEISFVDAQVGRILEALERLSLSEKTVILVTSDHGEAFGEHGMIRHGFEVWEELVRVPLIVHVPGTEPKVVEARRSLIDVAATILDQFNVEVNESEDEWMRGASLYPDVFSSGAAEVDVRPILVDMPEGPHNQQRQAFYSGDFKLIVSRGRAIGLYDLAKDPAEKHDLSEDAELLARMRNELDRYLSGLRDVPATR